jgi:phospholipid/cholesterol/gamma-HCH transport system permease protein
MIALIFRQIGQYTLFVLHSFRYISHIGKRRYEILKQMKRTGYDSLLLISVTSAFTGLVTALQATYQTHGYIPKSFIGVLVGKSTMIELAPVLTALVLAGKVGASLAAEIGSMKVTEQLEAMETMAIDPHDYLYLPRIIAGLIMVPLLTIYADVVGIFSAYFFSFLKYGINQYIFFSNMKNYFLPSDLWGGLVKSLFFGFVITTIACFHGSKTEGGAEGVGKVTTEAVVYSSILILILDFVVASFLFGGTK